MRVLQQVWSSLRNVPLGLVRSSWGGTPIQRWSSADAVKACPQGKKGTTSDLFNGMIHTFIGLEWSAAAWYQGESNTAADGNFVGPKYYSCALPALISDWRGKLNLPSLPFFVVELSAYCNERDTGTYKTWCDLPAKIKTVDYHLPSMRLAQSAAEKLANVFIVSASEYRISRSPARI